MKVETQLKKKKSFFKKVFIKICKLFSLDIIDQSELYLPTSDNFANNINSIPGIKSINVPQGKVNITRKVKNLTIIIRSYTLEEKDSKFMLDQNKQRIFSKPKLDYTLATINSVIKSCHHATQYFKELKINLIITDDKSSENNLEKIKKCLDQAQFETSIINIKENEFENEIKKKDENGETISNNMISNMRNIYKSINIFQNDADDLIYFLEDDYIHKKEAILEMLFTYEKVASQLNKELFLCPADYPYLYSNINSSKIFIGEKYHWRTVNETLITFLTSKKMLLKYLNSFISMATTRHHPMEKKLHEIYEKEICLSPIPSLAMHCTYINTVYGIPPNFDWENIWKQNKFEC